MASELTIPRKTILALYGRWLLYCTVVCIFSLNRVLRMLANRWQGNRLSAALLTAASLPDSIYGTVRLIRITGPKKAVFYYLQLGRFKTRKEALDAGALLRTRDYSRASRSASIDPRQSELQLTNLIGKPQVSLENCSFMLGG